MVSLMEKSKHERLGCYLPPDLIAWIRQYAAANHWNLSTAIEILLGQARDATNGKKGKGST